MEYYISMTTSEHRLSGNAVNFVTAVTHILEDILSSVKHIVMERD